MIIRTGREPRVEHIRVPVGTKRISFATAEEFSNVPISDLDKIGEVWLVRTGPSKELTAPLFVFWEEPNISKRGMAMDFTGYPEKMRQEVLDHELTKSQAPDDVLIEHTPSRYDPQDLKAEVRITFWEIDA